MKKEKEKSQKYVRNMSYVMYFYFGLRTLLFPVLFMAYEGIALIMNSLVTVVWLALGYYSTYKLRKGKSWAIAVLALLFLVHTISIMFATSAYGRFKFPAIQFAFMFLVLGCYRHIKHVK